MRWQGNRGLGLVVQLRHGLEAPGSAGVSIFEQQIDLQAKPKKDGSPRKKAVLAKYTSM